MKIDGVSYDVWVALRKESVDRNECDVSGELL